MTVTDIGLIALLLAFVVSIYAAVAAPLGSREGFPELVSSARRGVYAIFGLLTLSVGVLVHALVTHDFGLRYVSAYTSRDMDLMYLVSAVYAGNDGSLLFWAWTLSILAGFAVYNGRHDRTFTPYVLTITMAVLAFFLLLIILVANPFDRLPVAPRDGQGMNPMLENIGMIFHPTTTFLGYVGLTIPFAFAIAALIVGRLDGEWIRRSRMWALFAWLMLGIGNILGAQWAYVTLGWGGYWAWDPVENASLMPWLVVTAYLHAAVILRRRSMFKVWAVLLIAAAFLLTIFGTFLTRTGFVSSVHTFGQSSMEPFFLTFLGVAVLLTLGLTIWRLPGLQGEDEIEGFMSRENWVLITNLILVGMTVAVMIGTIYPVLSEAFIGRKIEMGQDFYNQVNGPILLALIVALGICPILAWRRSSKDLLMAGLVGPAVGAVAVAVALLALGMRQYIAVFAFAVCAFVIFSHLGEWYRGTRARQRTRGGNPLSALAGMVWSNRPRYGAHITHLAIVVMAIGVVGSSFLEEWSEANLRVGETMSAGSYTVRYEGMAQDSTPSRQIVTATVTVLNGDRVLAQLTPETIFHRTYEQPVSEVGIYTTLREDVYVILAGWTADGSASFKVEVNPLVIWIWIGGGLFLLGGLVAMWPQARRQTETAEEESAEAARTVI